MRSNPATPEGVSALVKAQVQGLHRLPGGSRRSALHLHPSTDRPVEDGTHHKRDRAFSHRVQAPHQNTDGAASGQNCNNAVLSAPAFQVDHDAQSRRMGNTRRTALRVNLDVAVGRRDMFKLENVNPTFRRTRDRTFPISQRRVCTLEGCVGAILLRA